MKGQKLGEISMEELKWQSNGSDFFLAVRGLRPGPSYIQTGAYIQVMPTDTIATVV